MNAGNHHGIHDFPFQSIEQELNGFRLAADSCDGNGTTDEDGIGAEGQHLKDVFPMTDTAVHTMTKAVTEGKSNCTNFFFNSSPKVSFNEEPKK